MECLYFDQLTFHQAREIQIEAVDAMKSGGGSEKLIFCQHPATITLGKRVPLNDVSAQLNDWRERGIEVIQTDRGGEMTYHAPGQLVLYPVVDLRKYGLGVRNFVELVLECIAGQLELPGVSIDMKQVGLWTSSPRKKIASVGLRMHSGVTNHGFSVNLSCDIDVFDEFPVCGHIDTEVTSLHLERGVYEISVKRFSIGLANVLKEEFAKREKHPVRCANM